MKQPFSPIRRFTVFFIDHLANTFMHHDQTDNVGQPIAGYETGTEKWPVEGTYQPGEYIGQRNVDKSVIPPGQGRKNIACQCHDAPRNSFSLHRVINPGQVGSLIGSASWSPFPCLYAARVLITALIKAAPSTTAATNKVTS